MTRVLVIDDCEEVCEIIAEILRGEGYDVGVAADGRTGLIALEVDTYDAVLCDLVLPLSDGSGDHDFDSAMAGAHCISEICRRHPTIPVIAISGELVGSPLSTVRKFGACATLSKPFGRHDLVGALNLALATQQPH